MTGEDRERLLSAEENIRTILKNQTKLLDGLDDLGEKMRDVLIELGGAPSAEYRDPDRKTLRKRLHDLEQQQATESLVTEALKTARQRTWGRAHVWAILAISAVGGAASILRLFGITG